MTQIQIRRDHLFLKKTPTFPFFFSLTMPLRQSSIHSCKSVSFDEMDTVYYTHSANEYDRTVMDEPHPTIYQIEQDPLVERNTFANGRRSSFGYAVILTLRSMNSCK